MRLTSIFLLAFIPFSKPIEIQSIGILVLKLIKYQIKSTLVDIERNQCINDLENTIESAENLEIWALQSEYISALTGECAKLVNSIDFMNLENSWFLKLMDAQGKVNSGLMKGNVISLGHYDECLEINEETSNGTVLGKYCTLGVKINLTSNASIHYSACIPKVCDLETFFEKTENFEIDSKFCHTKEIYECDGYDYSMLSLGLENFVILVFDATSKFPAGFLSGNFIELGSYDGCTEIHKADIRGKFCLGFVSPSRQYEEEMKFLTNSGTFAEYFGVPYTRRNISDLIDHHPLFTSFCVPSSCKQNDLQVIMNEFEKKLRLKIHYTFSEDFCATSEPQPFTTRAFFASWYFLFVCSILIAATIYDLQTAEKIKERRGYILAFSLYTNYNKLFYEPERPENLEAIDGIKVLSMAWIISGHMIVHESILPATNTIEAFEMAANPKYSLPLGGFLGIDTFLTISGFLIVYQFLQTKKKIPVVKFYAQQFIKFFPALISMLIFYTCLFEYLAEGPMWFFLKQNLIKPCLSNWLSTLFFMQNYWNTLEQCPIHSWYIAIVAQLTLLTPLIFIFNRKYNKQIIALGGILIIVTLNNFFTTIVYNLGSVPLEYGSNYNNHYYYLTHTRASPWLIGSIFGCFLHKTIKNKVILSKKTVLFGWLLSLSSIWFIVQSHTIIYNLKYNVFIAALFNAFARPVWASSICWIIFACNKGCGGIVTHILSGYIYQIISRVTYSMYLLHFPILQFYFYQRHLAVAILPLKSTMDFCGYCIITFIFSIFWTLAFVCPITALQNLENRNNIKSGGENDVIGVTVNKIH